MTMPTDNPAPRAPSEGAIAEAERLLVGPLTVARIAAAIDDAARAAGEAMRRACKWEVICAWRTHGPGLPPDDTEERNAVGRAFRAVENALDALPVPPVPPRPEAQKEKP
jgi:hypothetical protein